MRFNKPRQEVLDNISGAVAGTVRQHMDSIKYNHVSNILATLEVAIVAAVNSAMEELVASTYTDEDFEKDIKLSE